MRKFFSFRSSASSSANNKPTHTVPPSSSKENIYLEAPWQNDAKILVGKKIQHGPQIPKERAFKPVNQHLESEVLSSSHHGRSLSFSSAVHSCTGEGSMHHSSNLSGSPFSYGSSPCHVTECHAQDRRLSMGIFQTMLAGSVACGR